MYITVEEGSCIGCGSCAAICPDIFVMTNHDTARAIQHEIPDTLFSDIKKALKMCPVDCIILEKES